MRTKNSTLTYSLVSLPGSFHHHGEHSSCRNGEHTMTQHRNEGADGSSVRSGAYNRIFVDLGAVDLVAIPLIVKELL